jgi:hypothetical protein
MFHHQVIRFAKEALRCKRRPLSASSNIASSSGIFPGYLRFFSVNDDIPDSKKKPSKPSYNELPPPTWSISSLKLDQQHAPVSEEELSILAKRALINLPSDDKSSHQLDTKQLRQDLGNMIHMIQQVQDFATDTAGLTDEHIYDRPRGVTSAPVRRTSSTTEEDQEAEQVWDSLLKPKTTPVGAHPYFVIATNIEKSIQKKEE